MRFGVCYNVDYHEDVHGSPSQYVGQIMEQVEMLEEVGYDSVWFSEHHSAGYSFGNPAVIAAYAAARTKRIRIGTGVSLIPLHNPLKLAEEFALLDVLSNGRLEYGVGRGYLTNEYGWFDVPFAESHSRYREAMDFILGIWQAKGPFTFHGKHFNIEDHAFFPPPAQKPFPPIYASGGLTPDSYAWAGSKGFNLGTPLFIPDRASVRRNIDLYRENLVTAGYDPATREVAGITQVYCAADHELAVRDGCQYAANYYQFFSTLDKSGKQTTVPDFYAKPDLKPMNDNDLVFFGDPDNLVTRIARVGEDLGINFLLMEVAQGGAPVANVFGALELFGHKVIPRLRTPAPLKIAV